MRILVAVVVGVAIGAGVAALLAARETESVAAAKQAAPAERAYRG